MSNIHKIIEKCKRVGAWNIFASGLVYTTRVSLSVLERVLILISNYCRENACFYTDNRNIREFCLCKDGLHLLESGKKILASIFTVNLNKFFRETHTHTASTNIYLNDSNLRRTTYSLTTELQILHHERLIHSKNPRIGYLNTNSLRNKLTDLRIILKYLSLDYLVWKVWSVTELQNMSRNIVNVYVLKLLSLKKSGSFSWDYFLYFHFQYL